MLGQIHPVLAGDSGDESGWQCRPSRRLVRRAHSSTGRPSGPIQAADGPDWVCSAAMTTNQPSQHIEVGILTKGKPTLGMVLSNLLMQDLQDLRILIVDTSDSPVINREDVLFALKLSQDRHIRCDYQRSRDKQRNFSVGRMALLEQLTG